MKHNNEEPDPKKSQYSTALRKAIIITLLLIILLSLTFVRRQVKDILGIGSPQTIIEIKDIPITKRDKIIKDKDPIHDNDKNNNIGNPIVTDTTTPRDTSVLEDSTTSDTIDYEPSLPDSDEIIRIYEVKKLPVLQNEHEVELEYPTIARESGLEGTVLIEIVIGTDGNVEQAKVLQEVGPKGIFAEPALKAAKQWKFTPAYQQDRPVRVRVNKAIEFSLQ